MPYSEKKSAIYIWIPKTAGTSVAAGFARRGVFRRDGRKALWGRIPEDQRESWRSSNWQHVGAADLGTEVGKETFDKCFRFTFVRNPYDRLVSFYEYSKAARRDPRSVQFGEPALGTFEQWLEQSPPRTQLSYLADADQNLLVDFVGRYETLQRDVLRISLKLRILPFLLPRLNASRRGSYPEYYTELLRKKVDALYGEEIERFGYAFDRTPSVAD